jgi:dipeptidyl aminopeptidase/acylaminoacyl peptidase
MRAWWVLVGWLALQSGSEAAEKRAFTIEDLYRVQSIAEVSVSPDQKTAVFSVTTSDFANAKRASHIWQVDLTTHKTRQLTFGKAESAPLYSPDGKWISFISSRDGDANLYLLPTAGGEAKQFTHVSTGVSDPLWSPDGKSIVFSSDVYPECGADDGCNKKISGAREKSPIKAHIVDTLLYRHWTEWKDGTRTHIMIASVDTGKVKDLTPGDVDSPPFQLGGPLQYDLSPDGSTLVFVSNRDSNPASSTNGDLWLLSLKTESGEPRNITASNPAYDGGPKYSPDGRYIAYRMQKIPGYESDRFRLALYDVAKGSSSVLTESFQNWVEDFEWSADSRSIYFSSPLEGQTPVSRLDMSSGNITQVLLDKTIVQYAPVGLDRLLYVRHATGEPVELYVAEIAGGKTSKTSRLTGFNEAFAAEVDIRPSESIWVEGSGGAKIQVFIVKPHGFDPGRKYPLILNVHGGPQMQWTDGFRGDWQVYPGAGYVVAYPNPHGSTGYGQDFTAEISGDWGGRVYEDVMKVTDALEKLPYVDRDRMGAMGWSYGGYMMNWLEGHTTRFKALASMMGIFNLRSFYGATEELWFPEHDLKGQPWNSELYERWSPDNFVKNFKTPCLVISGERDYRVPYTQALQFFTALQKMTVPSRLIVFANAGHWPGWYEMALYYTAHLDWFHRYLGGSPPPFPPTDLLRR